MIIMQSHSALICIYSLRCDPWATPAVSPLGYSKGEITPEITHPRSSEGFRGVTKKLHSWASEAQSTRPLHFTSTMGWPGSVTRDRVAAAQPRDQKPAANDPENHVAFTWFLNHHRPNTCNSTVLITARCPYYRKGQDTWLLIKSQVRSC